MAGRLPASIREGGRSRTLESLRALYLVGKLDEPTTYELLEHPDPRVCLWRACLACDAGVVSPRVAARLAERARSELEVEARSQLAASARRLPAVECLAIVKGLVTHDEDASDPHIPLLLWWALKAKMSADPRRVLDLVRQDRVWNRPLVAKVLAPRVIRRLAATGSRPDLLACAELLEAAPGKPEADRLMGGFEAGLAGRVPPELPDSLAEALARFQGGSTILAIRREEAEAVAQAIRIVGDEGADRTERARLINVLGEFDQPGAGLALLKLVCSRAGKAGPSVGPKPSSVADWRRSPSPWALDDRSVAG